MGTSSIFNSKFIQKNHGFTIVELLIVVVVIAILAAITIIAFTGIQNRATASSMSTDLATNSRKLEIFKVTNDHYPSTVDDAAWIESNLIGATGQASNGASYQYIPTTALDGYTQVISKNNLLYVSTNENSTPQSLGNDEGAAPVAPTATTITTTSLKITWSAVFGATSYNTTCARNTALTTTPITTGTTTSAEYTQSSLNAGTIYYCAYQPMYGTTSGVRSAVSAAITTPTPAVPSNLASSAVTATSFKLNWSNVSGAYRYNLQCALSSDTTYASPVYSHTATSISSGTTGVTISTGLAASTSYICRVASKGYNNASAYSGNLTVTTPAAV